MFVLVFWYCSDSRCNGLCQLKVNWSTSRILLCVNNYHISHNNHILRDRERKKFKEQLLMKMKQKWNKANLIMTGKIQKYETKTKK